MIDVTVQVRHSSYSILKRPWSSGTTYIWNVKRTFYFPLAYDSYLRVGLPDGGCTSHGKALFLPAG